MEMRGIKIGVVALIVFSILSGCASLAGTFGIASKQYVDEQLTVTRDELSTEIKSNSMEIGETKGQLEKFSASATQLEGLIVSMEKTVETTEELKQLADVLEGRLANLPVETIRQLVGILDQYLEGK
jgi:hypothetical protein